MITALAPMTLQLAGADLHRHGALADAVIDDQVGDEPLLVDAQAVLDQLLVQDVQHRLAGDVADEVGARALAARRRRASPGGRLVAVEDDAHVLQRDAPRRRPREQSTSMASWSPR